MKDTEFMWLPDKLHASLPTLYSGAALLTFYYANSFIGYFSGILLLTASGLIWKLRRDHQKM